MVRSLLIVLLFLAGSAEAAQDFTRCEEEGISLGEACLLLRPVGAACSSDHDCLSGCCVGVCGLVGGCPADPPAESLPSVPEESHPPRPSSESHPTSA